MNYQLRAGFEYHVFLSHNSKDKPAIKQLKVRLESKGIRCWYDEDELRPGVPWQPLLEEGIRKSQSVIVAIANSGLGPWEDEEMQAALRLAVKGKRPVIPVLLPESRSKPELPMFLENRTWVDLGSGYDGYGINKLIWGITGDKPDGDADGNYNDNVRKFSPFESAFETFVNGTDTVLIESTEANLLLTKDTVAVYPAIKITPPGHGSGLIIENGIRKRRDVAVGICRYSVDIVNFSPFPKCYQVGESRGAAEAIEAVFILAGEYGEIFPMSVSLVSCHGTTKLQTPYNMPEKDIVSLRYFINANCPGIYWIACNVYLSVEGNSELQKLPLHARPIAVAFYEPVDRSELSDPVFEFRAKAL